LEGLEISEIHLSSHLDRNEHFRMDAEFRSKDSLLFETLLFDKGATTFGECSPDILHPQEIQRNYVEENEGVWFFRAQNIRPLQITKSNQVFISFEDAERLNRNRIRHGDVLMTRTGANAGDCAEFRIREEVIASSHTFIIRQRTYSPSFLAVFLNTRPALKLIFRGRYGCAQPEIAPYYLKQIPILNASRRFQQRITDVVHKADENELNSIIIQQQAENSTVLALGLDVWQVPEPLTYECSLRTAFESGRLDAEFFRTKFDELRNKLAELAELVSLGDIALVTNGKTVPYDEDGTVPIVRSGDLSDISSHENLLRAKPSEDIFYLKKGDVLISSIGFGSIGKVQVFDLDIPCGAVSEVTVIRTDKVNPYFLCSYLRSIAGQLQFERWTTGATGQLHLYPRDVRLMFVPLVSEAVQLEIESFFKNGAESRANSKSLLERAKRAVEIAIEESEETALAYLDGKHYLADELLPKLFSPNRHYIDLATVQRTIEAEALVYEPTTINRYLHEWTREGRIHDAGRGWYSNLPHAFQPVLETPPLPELEKLLRKHFPLLEFTVWSTRQLTTFFHHYAARHATFLMVDRDAMDTVADVLTKAGHHVVIHPLGDAAKNFALTQDETIILRPRLSSDHKETYAPIEQMLVDLHHEIQKLGLFDLAEFQSIFENLANRYRLNVPALKRYAERRKTDSTELLKLGGII
jgi:restriction endonuclease S subunit